MNDATPLARALDPGKLPGPLLAIDTSIALAVAVLRPGAETIRATETAPRRHAELLAPLIADCLDSAGLAIPDLAAIAVGTGPAAFTGLRVGLMTARALALPSHTPVWGAPSLDATALGWLLRHEDGADTGVLVARDARRRELFVAGYRTAADAVERVVPFEVCDAARLAALAGAGHGAMTGGGWSLTGDTTACTEYGLDVGAFSRVEPDPAVDAALLGLLAAERAARGADVDADPLYLRRPDVQVPQGAKRASR